MSWVFKPSAATVRSAFIAVAMAVLLWTLVERVRVPSGTSSSVADAEEIPPEELLRTATARVRPVYPAIALRARLEGVTVANVSVDAIVGDVRRVRILQSPSTEFADAVREALAKWHFALGIPAVTKTPVMDGRVIFYFLIRSGIGQVFVADEAPNHAISFDVLTSEVR
jgi:TonB family protein